MHRSTGLIFAIFAAFVLQSCKADEPQSPEPDAIAEDTTSPGSLEAAERGLDNEFARKDLSPETANQDVDGLAVDDLQVDEQLPKPDPLANQDERRIAPKEVEPSICPDPADCVPITKISVGHGASGLTVLYNPDLNDPIALYGDMLSAIMSCAQSGTDMLRCVQNSNAPELCKTVFESAWSESEGNEVAAFGASFFNPDISCLPEETSE